MAQQVPNARPDYVHAKPSGLGTKDERLATLCDTGCRRFRARLDLAPLHRTFRRGGPAMNARPRADARQKHVIQLVLEIHKVTLDPTKRTKTGSMPNLYVEEIQALCRRILNGVGP
jgi:hypothetical protein